MSGANESTLSSEVAAARAALRMVTGEPGVAKPDSILIADGMQRNFGGLAAVDVAHLEIPRHAITALIGPNGAGKTTLFNLLSGFDTPTAGHWSFDGHQIEGLRAYRIAQLGMVRTFQLTKALNGLTVLENMLLAARDQTGESLVGAFRPRKWRRQDAEHRTRAMDLLHRFKLDSKADDFAATLSGGQKKLLEMARSLMVEPSLVMLDEPMAGVNPALVESLLEHVQGLRDEGRTVLFVEHDMDVVMTISDWVVCMAEGSVIAEGTPESVAANAEVIDAYLGRVAGES